jgi:phospho-N-acetylmuramoyl-pentapeptide-transferase
MFYFLYKQLGSQIGWFRIFQYTSLRAVMGALTALLIGLCLFPWFIRRLQSKQIKQIVRDDGPETHFKKRDTPTMGGSLIIFSVVVPMLLWGVLDNIFVWMTMTVTVGYGMIGFYDDYQKISKKNSAGLAGRWKLFWQFTIAGGVMAVLLWGYGYSPVVAFPFARFDLYSLYIGPFLYLLFATVVIAGFSNAVNLTDGLDGLAIVPVTISSGTFLVLSYAAGGAIGLLYNGKIIQFNFAEYLRVPSIPGAEELSVFAGAMAGAGLAFLWYNSYPAQVFMGDVGALALGGGLGTMAVCTKNEFLLVIIGGVFVMETLSVVLQVSYFKYMKRKFGEDIAKKNRLFKMTPIHHHFEKSGWPEPKVIVRFWIISVVLSLVAISSLKLR